MRAITLKQPWAQLVALRAKRYETRSWMTRYRGAMAIHAGLEFTREARALCGREPFASALLGNDDLPTGCVIAISELAAVYRTSPEDGSLLGEVHAFPESDRPFGDFSPGRYAWLLQNVRALEEPIPARGAQGLWNWDPAALGFAQLNDIMKKKTTPTQYRQGDVLIERVASLPKTTGYLPSEDGRVILAHGEMTGHCHQIEEPKLASLHEVRDALRALGDLDDVGTMSRLGLHVAGDTAVVHDEHSPIPLEKGSYLVRRQREYSPTEIRNVAD